MTKGLILSEEVKRMPQEKPPRQGPGFLAKAGKAILHGTGKVLGSGWFWCLAVAGGGVYTIGGALKADNREQEAFETRIEKRLTDDGFTILAADEWDKYDNVNWPSKRLKFPSSYDRGVIITAQKNAKIYDVGAVRQQISKSGYSSERIIGFKLIEEKAIKANPKP